MLLRWVGGKSKLAEEIISTFPPHSRYIEPFFGAGWVFFKKPNAKENIINDINSDLINLYNVVRTSPQELARLIHYTPKHESQFDEYVNLFFNKRPEYATLPDTMRALIFYYLVKNSFNALFKIFSVGSTGWNGDGVIETMWQVHEKLKNTDILNRDVMDILQNFTNSSTLVYLDPPYAVTIQDAQYYYQYVMAEKAHTDLRDFLVGNSAKFMWVMSYDIHPFVDKLYAGANGIHMIKTSEQFQSSINKNKSTDGADRTNAFRQEYLITNFDVRDVAPLFSGI